MASIKLSVVSMGTGTDALTGKSETEGITVAFEQDSPCFCSWRSLKNLIAFRFAQTEKGDGKPAAKPASATIPTAIPATAPIDVAPASAGNGAK